jgi:hypothetical protein
MLTKVALMLHGKLMAVAVAGVLVIGGGTAVAVAAATGALPTFHGANVAQASSMKTPGDDGHENEIHGVASDIATASFTLTPVKGQPLTVTVSTHTVLHNLKNLTDLKDGDQVEVKGALMSNGTFAASDIEASHGDGDGVDDGGAGSDQGAEDVHGTVVSVGSDSFVITVVGGDDGDSSAAQGGAHLTVTVTPATKFNNLSGLGALKIGDTVTVSGAVQGSDRLVATAVEGGFASYSSGSGS